jgi:aspartate/methionine/tyrosine aminotransferase
MRDTWLAERTQLIELSGIRKVFDLGKQLRDPVNLSIGQPDFDVPELAKAAAIRAIEEGKNGYTVTQGIAELREKVEAAVQAKYPHADRGLLITSGTSGGVLLALWSVVNPGDEVIFFDPYFVAYPHWVTLAGGTSVYIDTYADFQIDPDKVAAAITQRTKAIIVNSPANPTGVVLRRETLRALAELAAKRGVLLISDEVYSSFCYDEAFTSPAEFNDDVVVLDGFSKTYGMTGWRLGYAHGPRRIIEEMTKLQQCTFVCAPSIVQYAGVAALDCDMSATIADYRRKRDRIAAGLQPHFHLVNPTGAFYAFPQSPWGTASDFVTEAIRHNLLLIPGRTFSRRDTHFRLSYAASDLALERGLDILQRLAQR